jgi:hypothetical protein
VSYGLGSLNFCHLPCLLEPKSKQLNGLCLPSSSSADGSHFSRVSQREWFGSNSQTSAIYMSAAMSLLSALEGMPTKNTSSASLYLSTFKITG